jgi:MoaA/NifB/PqqE/SkfB family radical SAM enzyme
MKITNSDYYCSQKFWWLSVDIEKMQTLSCCAATSNKVNINWLKNNPGQLFNTTELKKDRQMMLEGQLVDSCFSTCWKPENNNLSSRRLEMKSNIVTHTSVDASPEVLHIIVGNHCNMSCVYCCKQYSSSWTQDILNNGEYSVQTLDDRYKINSTDRILLNLSQKDIVNSAVNTLLIDEIVSITQQHLCPQINITGGEPFLYLNLENLISKFSKDIKIQVWSGLGVNPARFAKTLNKLVKYSNVSITISAENIREYYEFNRYGNSWKQFETNLDQLNQTGIPYNFNTTIGNLTLFGLPEFFDYIGDREITYSPCNDPDFLAIHVLDATSKQLILKNLDRIPAKLQSLIVNSIDSETTEIQKLNLRNYLTSFADRRRLSLNIFPKSFTQWIYD